MIIHRPLGADVFHVMHHILKHLFERVRVGLSDKGSTQWGDLV